MIPFKIYTRKEAQTRFKRHCSYQNQFDLISRNNRFLPFIIKRDLTSNQIKSWRVYDLNDILKYTINPATTSYEIFTSGTDQYLIYYGAQIEDFEMDCGSYYLKISDNVTTWYSEVFKVKDFTTNTNPYTVLRWKHNHDVGDIIYQTGYENLLYLDIELGEPEYEHEEEVAKNTLGEETDVLIRNRKVYKTVIASIPEYLVDALSLSLHGADDISLTLPENVDTISEMEQARVSLNWINDGCFANVEIAFKVEESLIQKTCNSDDELTEVEVIEPEDPEIVLLSTTNPSTNISTDGGFTVDVTNYEEPEYSLNGTTWQSSGIFTGLSEGNHTVYVRVESGKTGSIVVTLFSDCSYFNESELSETDNVYLFQINNCELNDFN